VKPLNRLLKTKGVSFSDLAAFARSTLLQMLTQLDGKMADSITAEVYMDWAVTCSTPELFDWKEYCRTLVVGATPQPSSGILGDIVRRLPLPVQHDLDINALFALEGVAKQALRALTCFSQRKEWYQTFEKVYD
jgi:hypothetical protein